MKRVVIEMRANDIILAKDIQAQSIIIGRDASTCQWVYITLSNEGFRVLHLDSIGCFEAYKDRVYNTVLDAAIDCSLIQFYQFPDFRSAMEYYLEQSK